MSIYHLRKKQRSVKIKGRIYPISKIPERTISPSIKNVIGSEVKTGDVVTLGPTATQKLRKRGRKFPEIFRVIQKKR